MWKVEFLLISNFSVALLLPCNSRAYAAEHVASPCKNWNFWFCSLWFSISVLHFWSPCDSRAHAVECKKQNFFQFFISVLHVWSPCDNRAHATECEIRNIFHLPISMLYYYSLCGNRAHAAEHVASTYRNRNFQFHSFRFLISMLHFLSSCSSIAHAAECGKQNFF